MQTNALTVLKERGFIQQVTDEAAVQALLDAGPVTVYIGYDPTADSLHVGNLVTLMALRHLEQSGHRPLCVLGGGTAMVGDPSGKTEMRQMLDGARIDANLQALRGQIARFLGVDAGTTRVVNNGDWLLKLSYIDFLRDIGRHFSVNRMLSAEAYKSRLERGLSFIEFNYQILQAYDFLELRRRYDCRLQMGGDDQWGNILAGVDLCRRIDQEAVQGLTFPLLTTATGDKMGKTAAGAVWLSAEKFRPYDYYQYWINTHDADVRRFLAIFTHLPMGEIEAVEHLEGADRNAAKAVLAFETTALVHGRDTAVEVHRAAQGAFGGRVLADSILPSSSVPRGGGQDEAAVPTTPLTMAQLAGTLSLAEVLVLTGLATSKNEARRLITQGAVRLGDLRPEDGQFMLTPAHFENGPLLLRAGKKKVHRLTLG